MHLGDLLAHAQDEVALGDESGGPRLRDDVEAALVREGRPDRLNRRGTVSALCAGTAEADANTSPSRSGLPEKSGMRTSTFVPGFSSRISRTVCA